MDIEQIIQELEKRCPDYNFVYNPHSNMFSSFGVGKVKFCWHTAIDIATNSDCKSVTFSIREGAECIFYATSFIGNNHFKLDNDVSLVVGNCIFENSKSHIINESKSPGAITLNDSEIKNFYWRHSHFEDCERCLLQGAKLTYKNGFTFNIKFKTLVLVAVCSLHRRTYIYFDGKNYYVDSDMDLLYNNLNAYISETTF